MATEDRVLVDALQFLPPALASRALHKFLAPQIEWAINRQNSVDIVQLPQLVTDLGIKHEDREAVAAYFNTFINPAVGTPTAMKFLFKLLDLDVQLKEWFNAENNLPIFRFSLLFSEYSGALDIAKLLQLINSLKNERSHLIEVRQQDCGGMVTFGDGQGFGFDVFDSTEGYIDPKTGVLICLYANHHTSLEILYGTPDGKEPLIRQGPWGQAGQVIDVGSFLREGLLDIHQILSEPAPPPPVSVTWSGSTLDYYDYGASIGTRQNTIDLSGESQIILPGEAYRTRTFTGAIVFSDYGTLSGGEGFGHDEEDYEGDPGFGFSFGDWLRTINPVWFWAWLNRRKPVDPNAPQTPPPDEDKLLAELVESYATINLDFLSEPIETTVTVSGGGTERTQTQRVEIILRGDNNSFDDQGDFGFLLGSDQNLGMWSASNSGYFDFTALQQRWDGSKWAAIPWANEFLSNTVVAVSRHTQEDDLGG